MNIDLYIFSKIIDLIFKLTGSELCVPNPITPVLSPVTVCVRRAVPSQLSNSTSLPTPTYTPPFFLSLSVPFAKPVAKVSPMPTPSSSSELPKPLKQWGAVQACGLPWLPIVQSFGFSMARKARSNFKTSRVHTGGEFQVKESTYSNGLI